MSDTRSIIHQAIEDALAEALPELENVDWDRALTGELGLESVQVMNLVMEIEDNLDISVPIDALADIQTLNQLTEKLIPLVEGRPA